MEKRGRPFSIVGDDPEDIQEFLDCITNDRKRGLKWVDISAFYGVTTKWLRDFRCKYEFEEPLERIEDSDELDSFVFDV